MKPTSPVTGPVRLYLDPLTAENLMTPNPVSLRDTATVHEAAALLTDRGIGAAPVIDESGRPVGVLSQADLVAHERQLLEGMIGEAEEHPERDASLVRDLMTPTVFAVAPERPADHVVNEMLGLNVHHLFVVDRDGVLVGVISAMDILRHLRP